MISIQEYDEAEAAAVQLAPQLHADNQWGHVPETNAELVRVREPSDLQILLNRFQCDRYRTYMYELGGFSEPDLEFFRYVINKLMDMQRQYYPETPPVMPIETVLSAMTIYHKIKAARPGAATILEVGPGAGLNALFFSVDPKIKNYTQIEATQATYLSQAMLNQVCYGNDVWEAANSNQGVSGTTRLWHVPWWRVDDLYERSMSYDVITANACLNEISNEMVERYLRLFGAKAHRNTLLLLQDLGAFMYRTDIQLRDMLAGAGWYLRDVLTNYEIEEAVGNCGHGDAVTTWWLTRLDGDAAPRPVSRGAPIPTRDELFARLGMTSSETESMVELMDSLR